MGSLPPVDTTVRGSVILLRVVDWICASRNRPCVETSSSEFITPEEAWEEDGGSALEDLYQAPECLLDILMSFLADGGVQEATAYILVSPMSSTIVVRSHEDAPQAGFVYRLRNGEYLAVMPRQL